MKTLLASIFPLHEGMLSINLNALIQNQKSERNGTEATSTSERKINISTGETQSPYVFTRKIFELNFEIHVVVFVVVVDTNSFPFK